MMGFIMHDVAVAGDISKTSLRRQREYDIRKACRFPSVNGVIVEKALTLYDAFAVGTKCALPQ